VFQIIFSFLIKIKRPGVTINTLAPQRFAMADRAQAYDACFRLGADILESDLPVEVAAATGKLIPVASKNYVILRKQNSGNLLITREPIPMSRTHRILSAARSLK
jgi:hypothetical protein